MREVELKAVVDDVTSRRQTIERAGAKLTFDGKLVDKRYDVESRELSSRDEVLRARRYESDGAVKTYLDWKGATEIHDVHKVREEISTLVDDAVALEQVLERLGFVLVMQIDREI